MITRSTTFHLGNDKTRMKDWRDAERQHRTVDRVLHRFFADHPGERHELQVVADEVGMGKTFVALGVAFSLLEAMKRGAEEDDLRSCYQKVLIVTPINAALAEKWVREVGEFVRRTLPKPADQEAAKRWFKPVHVEQWDELATELRRRGQGASVIVARMSLFQGSKLDHYDVKRRVLLGALFRHWGTRFRIDKRRALLKGAPPSWPTNPDDLLDGVSERDRRDRISLDEEDLRGALANPECGAAMERLLDACNEIATPYTRDRDERFKEISDLLNKLYVQAAVALINQAIPLVIVDEAHNWRTGKNGLPQFAERIAPRSRRALLLTATPFQLRPEEMLEILKVSDSLAPTTTQAGNQARIQHLRQLREDVIRPVLANSEIASREFARAWRQLPAAVTQARLAEAWSLTGLTATSCTPHRVSTSTATQNFPTISSCVPWLRSSRPVAPRSAPP